jgi:hypothetical protein
MNSALDNRILAIAIAGPAFVESRGLEFVHFWSRMFRPLDDDKLQEASIQVGL